MSYVTDDNVEQIEERHRYSKVMGPIFLVLALVWLGGAALMFTAAFKGSTMSNASPVAVNTQSETGTPPASADGAAPVPAPAAPQQ